MTIHFWRCDKCGKEYREGGGCQVSFVVGQIAYPADGRLVDNCEHADLCAACQFRLLAGFVSNLDHDVAAALAKECGATE